MILDKRQRKIYDRFRWLKGLNKLDDPWAIYFKSFLSQAWRPGFGIKVCLLDKNYFNRARAKRARNFNYRITGYAA